MKKIECYNCNFKTECKKYNHTYLCHICANTGLSYASIYPIQYTNGEQKIMRGIAYIGNLLLEEIKNKQ